MPRPFLDLPAAPFEIGPAEPRWPREVGDLRDPPPVLHVAGDPPPWPRAVAIVGTRRADDDALEFTHRLAGELAQAGCTVLSGGARGIDAAAHEGALEQGGCTVAVLATGLQRAYPPQNAGLLADVARRGALVSETADCEPHRGRFLGRNRLIAALARVVVVVQAPYKSGALSTAAHARKLKRPLLAVPASPWDIRGEGNLALLAQGAGICTRAPDVLSVAAFGTGARPGGEPGTKAENLSSPPDLSPEVLAVWQELGSREKHIDQLVRATRLPTAQVQRALVELVLGGLAREGAPGRYRRPPPGPTPQGPR